MTNPAPRSVVSEAEIEELRRVIAELRELAARQIADREAADADALRLAEKWAKAELSLKAAEAEENRSAEIIIDLTDKLHDAGEAVGELYRPWIERAEAAEARLRDAEGLLREWEKYTRGWESGVMDKTRGFLSTGKPSKAKETA